MKKKICQNREIESPPIISSWKNNLEKEICVGWCDGAIMPCAPLGLLLLTKQLDIYTAMIQITTYDQRQWKARDPVCSPIDKPLIARLVVGWVTTSESLVLYVL